MINIKLIGILFYLTTRNAASFMPFRVTAGSAALSAVPMCLQPVSMRFTSI
jgi:hypothetical protein